jgi:hypothetical protein
MTTLRSVLTVAAFLAALPAPAAAKNIILSDSLLANADKWSVKQGAQWMGKIHKWSFGDYAVVASQQGWTTTSSDTNFWKTKMASRTRNKFSFVLRNKTDDSAFVSAAHEVTSQSNPGLNLGHGTTVGGTGRTNEADRFVAMITVNRDTTEAWMLSIAQTDVSDRNGEPIEGEASHAATLTSGQRGIVLNPVFSRKLDQRSSFGSLALALNPPAMGYEFVEEGRSLCAVEYYSTGLGQSYKNIVWMDRNLDPRMQLVLSAAMTAVMQLKLAQAEAPAQPEHR